MRGAASSSGKPERSLLRLCGAPAGAAPFAAAVLLLVSACGPIPVDQAERACIESARSAAGPRGEIGLGMTSDSGARARAKVEISSDWLMGRDPSAVFDACVVQRSGQMPTRPLSAQPGWRR